MRRSNRLWTLTVSAVMLAAAIGCSDSGGGVGPPPPPGTCDLDPSGNWDVTFTPMDDACELGASTTTQLAIVRVSESELRVTEDDSPGVCDTESYTCEDNGVMFMETRVNTIPGCEMRGEWVADYRFTSESTMDGDATYQLKCDGSSCPEICGCTSTVAVSGMKGGAGPTCL